MSWHDSEQNSSMIVLNLRQDEEVALQMTWLSSANIRQRILVAPRHNLIPRLEFGLRLSIEILRITTSMHTMKRYEDRGSPWCKPFCGLNQGVIVPFIFTE